MKQGFDLRFVVASELSSDGFVVDSTPPVMGEVTHVENPPLEESSQFTSSGISVEWNGFFDKESPVFGTQPGECKDPELH